MNSQLISKSPGKQTNELSEFNCDQIKDFKDCKEENFELDQEMAFCVSPQTYQLSSLSSYNQMMDQFSNNHRSLDEMSKILLENGVSFNKDNFSQENSKHPSSSLQIYQIQNTKYMQVVAMKIALGPFSQTIKIYNTLSSSKFESIQSCYHGNSTNIYNVSFNFKQYIVKSTSLQKSHGKFKSLKFMEILKEYFLTKIMSVLKIGPKLCSQFGFDMFLTDTDAFFLLECCQDAKEKRNKINELPLLKKNLKEMHLLSVVHRDIKPENIMYSPIYEKYVFIDFGMSETRKEGPGQLVFTSFAGTYAYCYNGMKKIFKNRQNSFVDIHFNDAYGLQLSIQEIKIQVLSKQKKIKQKVKNGEQIDLSLFLDQVKLKYALFMAHYDKSYVYKSGLRFPQEVCEEVMNFLYEIPLTEKIRCIYKDLMEGTVKNEDKFEDLKEIFESKIYFESYKGEMMFSSSQKENAIKAARRFYEQIQHQYCDVHKFKKMSVEKLEQILFDEIKISFLQPFERELYIVEYLNCKRWKTFVPVDKKISICKKYLVEGGIDTEKQVQGMKSYELLQRVFHEILVKFPQQMKMKRFFQYLRALENYFIIAPEIDLDILLQVIGLINMIEEYNHFTNLEKVQRQLLICLSFWKSFLNYSIVVYRVVYEMCQQIHKKVFKFATQSTNTSDNTICKIYITCINYFHFQNITDYKYHFATILDQLNSISFKSSYSYRLLNYIRYRLLIQIEKGVNIYIQKISLEQTIYDQMENDKQINSLIIIMARSYYLTIQIKPMMKYISLFDECVQIQQISNRHFLNHRLLAIKTDQTNLCKEVKDKKIQMIFLNVLAHSQVNQQTIIAFLTLYQNLRFIWANLQQLKIPLSKAFINIYDFMTSNIQKAIEVYEKLNKFIFCRYSKNIFYIELLSLDIQIQYNKFLKSYGYTEKFFEYRVKFYPLIKSFQKMIHLDRSNFVEIDHIYLLFYDIVCLKHIHGVVANRQILDYIYKKKDMILSIFSLQKTIEKSYICNAFSIMLYYLLQQNHLDMTKKGVDLVYSIVQKKNSIEINLLHFNQMIIKSLVKLGRFAQIFQEINHSSKFYSDHLSKSNIVELSKFYSFTIENVVAFSTEKQFFQHLKQSLPKFDFHKTPVIGIFLLFCIRPFNRKRFLKLILKSLSKIKYNGRYFILCRFYREFLQLKEGISMRKRQSILRKAVMYPSETTLDLEEMKRHMIRGTSSTFFMGILREAIDKKIMRLGQCCEVYATKRQPSPLNSTLKNAAYYGNRTTIQQQIQEDEW